MGDNAKALIGLAVTAVLAVVAYVVFGDNGLMAACVVAVVGLIAVFALQKMGGGGGDEDEEAYLDTSLADEAPAASSGGAAGGGLPTWSPEPLATWSPPEDAEPAEEITFTSLDEPEEELDTSTFDELASFDDLDAVAEVDTYEVAADSGTDVEYEEAVEAEVEAEPVRTSLFSAPAPIREDVSSADDILEASHATELHIGDEPGAADNSELAKLLAKVQSRLAAYE